MNTTDTVALVAIALGAVLVAIGCAFVCGVLIGRHRGKIAAIEGFAAADRRLKEATDQHWCGMKCLRQERGEFDHLTATGAGDCEPQN
jgi:hypothetical protein